MPKLKLIRSPYYVHTPFEHSQTTGVTVDVKVWKGGLGGVPVESESITKTRPSVDYKEFHTDISDIARAEINEIPVYEPTPRLQLLDNISAKWLQYTASYIDPVHAIEDITDTFLVTEGYSYYQEGANYDNKKIVLSTTTERRVHRGSFILLPFLNNNTDTYSTITINTEGGEIDNYVLNVHPSFFNKSSKMIQYVSVNLEEVYTDELLTITFESGEVYTYHIEDECRYSPVTVVFKNRYGMYEPVFFMKKRVDSLDVSHDTFVNNYMFNGEYSKTRHQYQKKNIQAKERVTLNTGYMLDTENELYRELMLSDSVYFYENGFVPVNVKSSSLQFKSRENDSLVDYAIEFEYAFNALQNV